LREIFRMANLPEGLYFLQARSPDFPASANMTAVEASGELCLFDAGGSGPENHAATRAALTGLGHAAEEVTRIFLTHVHADHSGGISLFRAVSPRVAVALHPRAKPMAGDRRAFFATFDFDWIRTMYPDAATPGRRFTDGLEKYLATGACPFEPFEATEALDEKEEVRAGSLCFRVLLGEGHAPGHVMFYEPEAKILIAGDTVGQKLSWHSPSSGGVSAYLDALEHAATLDIDVVLPAHGPVMENPHAKIESLADKIRRREDKIIAWLAEAPRSFAELCALMIGGSQVSGLFPSVPMLEGHLQRLERAGRIRREGATEATAQRIELCT
jgi:glyoxylase-like metal-dependent hydrolase (beta-lactamase superfamily II)